MLRSLAQSEHRDARQAFKGGRLLVDNSDVVLFVGKMLSERAADLSCPEDNDFHRPLDPPNDPRTP